MKIILNKTIIILIALITFSCYEPSRFTISTRLSSPVNIHPNRPGPGHIWIEGEWFWNGRGYIWRDGYWALPNRGNIWIPGRWKEKNRGWYWAPGRWKRR